MIAFLLAPFYILVNAYIVRWMISWMGACHHLFQTLGFRILFVGTYIFLSTSLLTGFLVKKPYLLHRFLKNAGNYFLGTFLYILIVVVCVDLGRIILKYGFHVPWIGSRTAFVITGSICTLLIIFISVYGILHEWDLKTTNYDITVEKSAEGMDSLKIVLIADTHFGYSIGKQHAKEIVRKINKEKPDIVCIAGDIFDNEYDAIRDPDQVAAILKSIDSRYGTYACWGNHDLNEPILAGFTFSSSSPDYDDPRMKEFLQKADICLLEDESILINNCFYITGRKDPSRAEKMGEKRQSPDELTSALDKTKPIIFLDHQPKELEELAQAGADLDLCGHTHDGQLFPGNIFTGLIWENSCGYLKKGSMHNIVTSGVGIWGPNMRVGTDSEICSVTVHFHS